MDAGSPGSRPVAFLLEPASQLIPLFGVLSPWKNYMGVIENRRTFHQAIADCLVDLTRFMKPRVCVLDGIRVLKKHGPKGGNSEDVELKATVAAGTDIVALDAWGAELMGLKADDVKSMVQGHALGLGTMDYRSLDLNEISVS